MNLTPEQKTTREELVRKVKESNAVLVAAQNALDQFDRNILTGSFTSLDDAFELEYDLREEAAEDCEGSYNVGDEEYQQSFTFDGKTYTAVLYDCEYNRHDKQYYYLEYAKFRIDDAEGNKVAP